MSDTIRRGRPPTLTKQRLADAGIRLGLPGLTMVGVAANLGVSQMALYKHVSGVDELKTIVAEEIFLRWPLPLPTPGSRTDLEAYLGPFSLSMWKLVAAHPGIAPYLLREDMITAGMMDKIAAHQRLVANAYGLRFAQSQWLLFTIAYHCVAVADTVLPQAVAAGDPAPNDSLHLSIDAEYAMGIQALILGTLALVHQV